MHPSDPKYDRLKLTEERIEEMAWGMQRVSSLETPLGKVLDKWRRPNGMVIQKVSVPIGVIGIIYEARPNVTTDVFSLCFKSGNVCVLKGGSDAAYSNQALVAIIRNTLEQHGMLPSDREATTELLQAVGLVDLLIPRGSQALIRFVRDNARVPIIETGAGICHTYFDQAGDKEKGREIVNNAKTRRVSVCNALDCLLIHQERLTDLPYLCGKLADSRVILYADPAALNALKNAYPAELLQPATPESFGTEFLDYKMAIRRKPSRTSPVTVRSTASASSANRPKPSANSSNRWTPPASTPMFRPPSPTVHSSASGRKSASARKSCMHAAPWRCPN